MKIIVCVKVINGEINPFDESALECALVLSDDVTVLSMGPENTKEVLKPLTRLGAKVTLLSDKIYAGADTLATSYVLAEAIKKMDYDLIICGRQSIDGDTAQVGPMLSARLNINVLTNVIKLDNNLMAITRNGEEQINLPSVVTVERGYYLRLPSIFSKVGDVTVWDNRYLNCDVDSCGLTGSPTRVLKTFESKAGKRHCKFITRNELIPLIEELRNKDFDEIGAENTGEKFDTVWAIGEKAYDKALDIAKKVVLIKNTDPYYIAKRAKAEKPEVILWNADIKGRRNAPICAVLLNTGLCADCTALGVEGNLLMMYRPARGGNVIGKIKCLASPQMATVRTKVESSDIIVSGGKGMAEGYEKLIEFAKSINAELGASRGLVDMGKASYENQIGLTGKMVSPKIYIAVGISGAVHHTCAIENSNVVIAINPDKNARIFEYADYGILEKF